MSVCVGVHANASATSGKEATMPQAVVVGIGTDDAAMQVPGEGDAVSKEVVLLDSPMAVHPTAATSQAEAARVRSPPL